MAQETPTKGAHVNLDALLPQFPTHCHDPSFWESLGRTVATFGFLEDVLGKAIFSFTATRPYDASEIDAEYEKWLPKLERALTDTLSKLITEYKKAVQDHPHATSEDLDSLITNLRTASTFRNVLCHGSWIKPPDANGASLPFFINNKMQIFNTPIDCQFLDKLQREVAILSCEVVNTVTQMGWQFPGSPRPRKSIFKD